MWWTTAFASTWTIPTDYPTIESALQSGHVVSEDTLVLLPGVHDGFDDFEAVGINSLVIQGSGVNHTTLVAAPLASRVLQGMNVNLEVSNMTLWGEGLNPCMYLENGVLDIHDVEFLECHTGSDAAGLTVLSADVFGQNLYFLDNSGGVGGAVSVRHDSVVSLHSSEISGGVATVGGGLYADPSNTIPVVLSNMTFTGNSAIAGGAVYTESPLLCSSCTFEGNIAGDDGGAITGSTTVTITDSLFRNNSAAEGGALGGDFGSIQFDVSRSVFKENHAGSGGAVALSDPGDSVFTNVAFCENTATTEGHAAYLPFNSLSSVRFENALFRGNQLPGFTVFAIVGDGPTTIEQAFFTNNAHVIQTDGTLNMHNSVVDGGALVAQGPGLVSGNLMGNGISLSGASPDGQVIDGFTVIAGTCDAGSPFARPVHEIVPGPPRLSHLGGPLFNVEFWGADADADGFDIVDDCDDANPDSYPGAPELCDGHDNDCNDQVDDNVGPLWYLDHDGDFYGNQFAHPVQACDAPASHVPDHTDCDDAAGSINPGVLEVCDDHDHNCDGHPDDGLTFLDYYADADGDGWGDGPATSSCEPVAHAVLHDGDCDDHDEDRFPGKPELCNDIDEDCDGHIDEDLAVFDFYTDTDLDGWGAGTVISACSQPAGTVTHTGDCAELDPHIHPGEPEICDGVDQDCDHHIDEDLATFDVYDDVDGDGFGAGPATQACRLVHGKATHHGDCADDDHTRYPGATETCNGIDDDCDNVDDNDVTVLDWYLDLDGDGYGAGSVVQLCSRPSDDHVLLHGDCADGDTNRYPTATEDCGGQDLDCDGHLSNGVPTSLWYPDADADGFGSGAAVDACAAPPQHVAAQGDCDETDSAVNPHALEVCDGQDNDCNGTQDDGDAGVTGAPTWYLDDDDDTYGDPHISAVQCDAPAHHVGREGDCDDANANVYEGAPEACADLLDNDCDGLVDADDPDYDGNPITFAADADGDGYGDPFAVELACPGSQQLGWVPLGQEDCNDSQATINPGQPEICDSVDNDCDDQVNENLPYQDSYPDADGDSFGDENASPISDCQIPPGRVTNASDCDDADELTNPLTLEICDGLDQNCSNTADEGLPTTDWYPDADGDGWGDETATPVTSCAVEPGVDDHSDCDDSDASFHPGAADDPEDGIDSDCDGTEETLRPPVVDTDGDGVPDLIDVAPESAGTEQSVDPSAADYGCGCSTPTPLWTWLRRR